MTMYEVHNYTFVTTIFGLVVISFVLFVIGVYSCDTPRKKNVKKPRRTLLTSWLLAGIGVILGVALFLLFNTPKIPVQVMTNGWVDAAPLIPSVAIVLSALVAGMAHAKHEETFLRAALPALCGIAALGITFLFRMPFM